MDETTETVCAYHPDRPTRLACSECGKPICADCSYDAAVGQKCRECAAPEGRYRVVQARRTIFARPSFQTAPVSMSLIAVNVAIFAMMFLVPDLERELVERFALANWLVADGQWWRIFTATFLHGSIAHVGFNMYALWIFGPRLEQQVGSTAFASMYAAAAAAGSTASYLLGPIDQVSIGASGAIFGLFGAWLFVAWRMRATPAGRAMFNQLFFLLAINLALPLLIPGIDWRAHMGGLAGGLLVAFLWSKLAVGRPDAERIRAMIGFAVTAVCLVAVLVL